MISHVQPLLSWARARGISERTAYRRYHNGTLGVRAVQTDTGRIMVDPTADECQGACLVDVHVECLTDAVLAELGRRGYRLDRTTKKGDTGRR